MGLQVVGVSASNTSRAAAVFPTEDSITRGFQERSLDFTPFPNKTGGMVLTIDLSGATGQASWPFIYAEFLATRLQTLQPGETCDTRIRMLNVIERLLDPDSTSMTALADSTQMLLMPPLARLASLDHLRTNLMCPTDTGELANVYEMSAGNTVTYSIIFGVPDGLEVLSKMVLQNFLETFHPEALVVDLSANNYQGLPQWSYAVVTLPPNLTSVSSLVAAQNASAGFILAPTYWTAWFDEPVTVFPFAAVAVTIRVNWCSSDPAIMATCVFPPSAGALNFTVSVLARIFTLNITMWDDAALVQLNPNVALPAVAIQAVPPERGAWRDAIEQAIAKTAGMADDFEFDTTLLDPPSSTAAMAAMYKNRYSITVVAGFNPVAFLNDDLSIVGALNGALPSIAAVEACASAPGAYDAGENEFDFTAVVDAASCYPLVIPLNLVSASDLGNACQDGTSESIVERPGFIGPLITPADNSALRLQQFIKFLINFQQFDVLQLSSARATYEAQTTAVQSAVDKALNLAGFASLHDIASLVQGGESNFTLRSIHAFSFQSLMCSGDVEDSKGGFVENLNLISSGLVYGLGVVLLTMGIVILLGLLAWTRRYRRRKVVMKSSPLFLNLCVLCSARGAIRA